MYSAWGRPSFTEDLGGLRAFDEFDNYSVWQVPIRGKKGDLKAYELTVGLSAAWKKTESLRYIKRLLKFQDRKSHHLKRWQ